MYDLCKITFIILSLTAMKNLSLATTFIILETCSNDQENCNIVYFTKVRNLIFNTACDILEMNLAVVCHYQARIYEKF